jgi:transcriptional regulator with GAF, ATPase, and Fis domain
LDKSFTPRDFPHRMTLREAKRRAIAEVERRFVEMMLNEACGNISEAARRCQMDRASVSRLVKKYRAATSGAPQALHDIWRDEVGSNGATSSRA